MASARTLRCEELPARRVRHVSSLGVSESRDCTSKLAQKETTFIKGDFGTPACGSRPMRKTVRNSRSSVAVIREPITHQDLNVFSGRFSVA